MKKTFATLDPNSPPGPHRHRALIAPLNPKTGAQWWTIGCNDEVFDSIVEECRRDSCVIRIHGSSARQVERMVSKVLKALPNHRRVGFEEVERPAKRTGTPLSG